MKKLTPVKIGRIALAVFCIALAVFAVVFVANTFRFRVFGQVVATKSATIDSVSHHVLLRERAFSALDIYLLDRMFGGRSSEYEYWTELRRNGNTVAVSDRFTCDSTAFDHPYIDSVNSSGAIVILDPRSSYQTIDRFDWVFHRAPILRLFDSDSPITIKSAQRSSE